MITGGLAFLDCLGFKGIWRQHAPEQVLDQLERTTRDAGEYMALLAPFQGLSTSCTFLSDSVVIGATPSQAIEMTDAVKGFCLVAAGSIALKVAQSLIRGNPPITMRGCVTLGSFLLRPNHIIGPAVDEAASLHERAQGAFIWIRPDLAPLMRAYEAIITAGMATLTPAQVFTNVMAMIGHLHGVTPEMTAAMLADPSSPRTQRALRQADKLRTIFTRTGLGAEFPIYPVPMKGGDFLECPVVNTIALAPDIDDLLRRYSLAMSDQSIDVMVKRQNTLRFLRSVEAQSKALSAECAQLA